MKNNCLTLGYYVGGMSEAIPTQLTKENKKFVYGLIKEGERAKEYELAMLWLTDCGLVHKVHRASTPNCLRYFFNGSGRNMD